MYKQIQHTAWVIALTAVMLMAISQTAQAQGHPALSLVDDALATDTAVASGNWSDPAIWQSGGVPGDEARIVIPQGMTVTVDGLIPARYKTIRIDGTLRFLESADTHLSVDTLVSSKSGRLEIGTAQTPIAAGVMATITFADFGPLDRSSDQAQFGRGAVLMGQTEIYGAQKTAWTTLAEYPRAGDSSIVLDEVPVGWVIGDEVVIAGTEADDPTSDERVMITAIDGPQITLDRALERDHVPPVDGLQVHVANMNRNIIIHSENPEIAHRGHVMFMHTLDVSIHYAGFADLGRTNKLVPEDDWYFPTLTADEAERGPSINPRGRYSVHFHRGGVDPNTEPALVVGSVVDGDPGWAYVNHSANVDFIDNVSYDVIGGAFQTESGDEIGSFVRNLAIRTVNPDYPILNPETVLVDTREISQDFAFQGDAFWVHGGGVSLIDNVASGSSGHGFIYWTEGLREVRTEFDDMNHFKVANIPNGHLLDGMDKIDSWWVPIAEFSGNVAYSASKGFASYYVHATLFEDIYDLTPEYLDTVHSTFEDFTVWNVRLNGIYMENCERFTFRDVTLINEAYPEAIGIQTLITVGNRSIWDNVNVSGFDIGMIVPAQGDITISGGTWSNEIDFIILPPQVEPRRPADNRDLAITGIQFDDTDFYAADERVHFQLMGLETLRGEMPITNEEDAHRLALIPDRIIVDSNVTGAGRLYFAEQAPDFVPVLDEHVPDEAYGSYIEAVAGSTNQQLYDDFGLAFAGALLPADAFEVPGVIGGYMSSVDSPVMNIPNCLFINEERPGVDFFDDFDFYDCWDASEPVVQQTSAFDHASTQ